MSQQVKELLARKDRLQSELQELENRVGRTFSSTRDTLSGRTGVRYWAERYPLHLLGAAMVTGFWIARRQKVTSRLAGGLFTGLLAAELKTMAARKAVRMVLSRVETFLEEE